MNINIRAVRAVLCASALALLSIYLALPSASSAQTTATQAFQITVTAPPCSITINTTPAPPSGIADGKTVYGPYQFTATNTASCIAPYTWSVTAGTLPTGLSLSSTGILTGTIATSACGSGTCPFSITVQVKDSGTTSKTVAIRAK